MIVSLKRQSTLSLSRLEVEEFKFPKTILSSLTASTINRHDLRDQN